MRWRRPSQSGAPRFILPPWLPRSAGVLSAVVAPESVSRPSVWVAYPATEAVVGVVEALDNAREGLLARQVGRQLGRLCAYLLRTLGCPTPVWA